MRDLLAEGNVEEQILSECEKILNYKFNDKNLILQALTHSSARDSENEGNERLEFLGDSILGLVISEYLFLQYPDYQEGELTRIKSAVVSRNSLAQATSELGLVAFVRLGKGLALKAKIPTSVLANVYESVVAALYFDGGFEVAKQFCLKTLKPIITQVENKKAMRNYKSILQQFTQKHFAIIPKYRVVAERGPEHTKNFKVEVKIADKKFKGNWARTKKEAEQNAAHKALKEFAKQKPDDKLLSDIESENSV